MKREYPLIFKCAHEGCKEYVRYSYSTMKDRNDSWELKMYSNGRWKCTRHAHPTEVLSPANLSTHYESVSEEVEGTGGHLYWNRNGFKSGPGFKAFADDFPPGTKIIITAKIELPQTT